MTALEQKLLEQLEQEQKLNNTILRELKSLFQEQNKLITQNTEEMKILRQKIEEQQQKITYLTENLMKLTKELEELATKLEE